MKRLARLWRSLARPGAVSIFIIAFALTVLSLPEMDNFTVARYGFASVVALALATALAASEPIGSGEPRIEPMALAVVAAAGVLVLRPRAADEATQANLDRIQSGMSRSEVEAILGPTLNFVPGRGLRYAVSFDDRAPQIIDALAQNTLPGWATSVKDNVRKSASQHSVAVTG